MENVVLELDPTKLSMLGTVSFYFCGTFLAISFISAILLQAAHEAFRKVINKIAVRNWLSHRILSPRLDQIENEITAIGTELFSLPYWQLVGQIGALIGTRLNFDDHSPLILALANIASTESLKTSQPSPETLISTELDSNLIRQLTTRAQAGINSLHAHLRSYWNKFDYFGSFIFVLVIASLMTTLKETQGQRFLLYSIAFFAWFATPILRRMIERLVPFR